jgi:hypothetical protein
MDRGKSEFSWLSGDCGSVEEEKLLEIDAVSVALGFECLRRMCSSRWSCRLKVFLMEASSARLHPLIGQKMLCDVCIALTWLLSSDGELKLLESQPAAVHL